MKIITNTARAVFFIIPVSFVSLVAPMVFAAEMATPAAEGKTLEKFTVTGSHIKRLDLEGASPLLTLDRDDIAQNGASSLSELLRNLPLNNGESFSELTQSTTPGTSGINLRGLGQDATLVLINGRRVANHAFALDTTDTFVDLNSIPMGAIERIEILKDGASATYGSDALAGVVNIILRKDYDDSEITLGYGQSGKHDALESRLSFATGVSNDSDNLTFIFDYFKRGSFLLGDRDFSKSAFPADAYDPAGAGLDWTSFDNFPANGYDLGGPEAPLPVDPSCGGFSFCSGFFDPNPYITALPKAQRIGGLVTFNSEINATTNFFSEFMINTTTTEYQYAPTALWGDADGVIFPGTHPANIYAPSNDLILYWRMTDAGPRRDTVETNSYRFLAGLEGSYKDIDWEFDVHNSRSKSLVTGVNYINRLALINAFNNGLLNPFGSSNPAEMGSVKAVTRRYGHSKLLATEGKINTELGELAGGPVAIAAGAERRYEYLSDTPDALTAQGDVIGQGSTQTSGSRQLTAVFAEVNLPVSNQVELQLAARAENYSDFGSTANPKAALRWQPISSIVLRMSRGSGFRAPSLPELHQAQTSLFKELSDTTRCNASGLDCAVQLPVSFGGNKDLDPEKSKSTYLGAVFEPTKALSMGLDFWRYEQTDVIDENTQFVLDNEASFSDRIIRDASQSTGAGDPGPIVAINDAYVNVAEQDTTGIDLSFKYRWKLSGAGTLTLQSMLTKVRKFERKATSGSPVENKLGSFRFPKLRGNLGLAWRMAVYSASVTANYIDGYKDFFYGIDLYQDGPADANRDFHMIDSYMSYDLQLAYTAKQDMKVTFGVKNLTDEDPPFSNATNIGYDSATHDPTGRFYYLRFNRQF